MSTNAPESLAAPVNPYAAPEAEVRPLVPHEGAGPDAADTRWHYLGRERMVKRLALLNDFGAFVPGVVLLLVLTQVVALATGNNDEGPFRGAPGWGLALALAVLVPALWLNVAVGYGLRRLRGWARWVEAALFGLFGLLIGLAWVASLVAGLSNGVALATIIGAPVVWMFVMLVSKRTAMVFSPTYAAVIAETPYFRAGAKWPARVSWGIYLGILGLGFLALIVYAAVRLMM